MKSSIVLYVTILINFLTSCSFLAASLAELVVLSLFECYTTMCVLTFILLHFILIFQRLLACEKNRVSSPHHNSSADTQGKLGDSPLRQVVINRVAVNDLGVNNGSDDDGSCIGK